MAFAYAEQRKWSVRQWVALVGAIAVNVGFLAAITAGLAFDIPMLKNPPPIIAEFFDPVKPEPVAVPTPEVKPMVDQEIEVPPPEVPIEIETPPMQVEQTEAPSTPAPTQPVAATQLTADRSLTPPVYPPTSRRLGEEGTVRLLIYVLPDGRVGDVKIDRSSGFPRLDEAAMTAARKDWKFRPATQGGSAVAAWGRYAVTFNLKQ